MRLSPSCTACRFDSPCPCRLHSCSSTAEQFSADIFGMQRFVTVEHCWTEICNERCSNHACALAAPVIRQRCLTCSCNRRAGFTTPRAGDALICQSTCSDIWVHFCVTFIYDGNDCCSTIGQNPRRSTDYGALARILARLSLVVGIRSSRNACRRIIFRLMYTKRHH